MFWERVCRDDSKALRLLVHSKLNKSNPMSSSGLHGQKRETRDKLKDKKSLEQGKIKEYQVLESQLKVSNPNPYQDNPNPNYWITLTLIIG